MYENNSDKGTVWVEVRWGRKDGKGRELQYDTNANCYFSYSTHQLFNKLLLQQNNEKDKKGFFYDIIPNLVDHSSFLGLIFALSLVPVASTNTTTVNCYSLFGGSPQAQDQEEMGGRDIIGRDYALSTLSMGIRPNALASNQSEKQRANDFCIFLSISNDSTEVPSTYNALYYCFIRLPPRSSTSPSRDNGHDVLYENDLVHDSSCERSRVLDGVLVVVNVLQDASVLAYTS
ncbi:hypothetical protein J6590_032518 [Homalodisca vitripennis]|nr:hypothetical protein J6590_032518 [Homalodisca vitripennis]